MVSEKKLRHRMKKAQNEHDRVLKKIKKTHARLATNSEDLRAVETKLAEYERQLAKATVESPGPAGVPERTLRAARLIVNPNAGCLADGTYSVDDLLAHLRTHGIDAQVTLKTSGKVIRKSARDAAKAGEALVIVAGGDGTIEKVAAQLVGSETTLGILPLGTMNNLARALGVPLDLEDACALLGMGTDRKIDVGCINVKAKRHLKYFLETAGLGLSAIAFPMGQGMRKGGWGALPRALRKIMGYKIAPVTVELDDGQVIHANSQVVTVSNAPLTGMNFLIAPDAKMDDGWLDVAIYDEMSKADLASYLWDAHNGQVSTSPKIKKYKSRHVIISPDGSTPVVSDKDALPEQTTLDIKIIPQSLRVIVGKGSGLTFPVDVAPSVPPLSGPQTTNGHSESPPSASEPDPKDTREEITNA